MITLAPDSSSVLLHCPCLPITFSSAGYTSDFAQGDVDRVLALTDVRWGGSSLCTSWNLFGLMNIFVIYLWKGCFYAAMNWHVVLCVCMVVFQSCEVMATASVSRPGGAQTTEKSQLILKGNTHIFVRDILILIMAFHVFVLQCYKKKDVHISAQIFSQNK